MAAGGDGSSSGFLSPTSGVMVAGILGSPPPDPGDRAASDLSSALAGRAAVSHIGTAAGAPSTEAGRGRLVGGGDTRPFGWSGIAPPLATLTAGGAA